MSFIQMCLAGEVSVTEIDNFVDEWHDGKVGEGKELHELLGMTWEEYSLWATRPSILPVILAARRNDTDITTELGKERETVVNRSETAREAM